MYVISQFFKVIRFLKVLGKLIKNKILFFQSLKFLLVQIF